MSVEGSELRGILGAMPRLVRRTGRLVIRPYRLSDYRRWAEGMRARSPARSRFDPGPAPPERTTREHFAAAVARNRARAKQDLHYVLGVFDQRSGEHLGAVDLFVLVRYSLQIANLGYWIHNQHWGRGYAREAAAAALDVALRDLRLHRVEAAMEPNHRASMAVARAIGMKRERLSKNYLFEDGRWIDLVVFAYTAEDHGIAHSRPTVRVNLEP